MSSEYSKEELSQLWLSFRGHAVKQAQLDGASLDDATEHAKKLFDDILVKSGYQPMHAVNGRES